jgi:hypothetical protein
VPANPDKLADVAIKAGPRLAPDAAMVLGIASTAMPFAGTPEGEAARWLRVLRLHGEAGAVLQALGVSEMPLPAQGEGADHQQRGEANGSHRDMVGMVSKQAVLIASRRGANVVGTSDVLMAVMHVYGTDFDQVLRTHGTDRAEVIERLGARAPASTEA